MAFKTTLLALVLNTLIISLFHIHAVLAFTPSSTSPYHQQTSPSTTSLYMTSSFFADATESKNAQQPEEKIQTDVNGNIISLGSIVQITKANIKAYSVPKDIHGSFNPTTNKFIPQDITKKSRKTNCLILPIGLRGKVSKIYNTNEWDRTHPIMVKFNAGDDREEEDNGLFHIPKAFMMHFDADEIEVLV